MPGRPLVIFLDQNHWVSLAAGRSDLAKDALKALAKARAAGEIVVPLSPVNYFETWHRREWQSRHRLAGVMRDISAYVTFGETDRLVRLEVRNAFRRRVGLDTAAVDAIGWGVRNAFDHPLGRIRLIDPVLDDGGPGEEPDDVLRRQLATMHPLAFEFASLAGPAVDFDQLPGVDTALRHRLGDDHVRDQLQLLEHLDEHAPPGRRDDCVRIEWMHALWDHLMDAAREVDLNPRLAFGSPPHGLDWLIDDVPTVSTWCTLEQRLLRDRNYRWTQHDLNDFLALAVAAAYSDVVVTERHWAHHLRQTSVVKHRGVEVAHRLDAILDLLDRPVGSGQYQRWPA